MTTVVHDLFLAPEHPVTGRCPAPDAARHRPPSNRWLPALLALAVPLLLAAVSQALFGHVPVRPLAVAGVLLFGNAWVAANGGAAEAVSAIADAGLIWPG